MHAGRPYARLFALSFAATTLVVIPANAQDAGATIDAVSELRQRLQAMESRVQALESQLAQRVPPTAAQRNEGRPTSEAAQGTTHASTPANLTLSGYAEVLYQWNFNQPSNGITNYRGFDTRHNSFTISNVVLDAAGALGPVGARLALQIGSTPETYYLAEPAAAGAAGAGASNFNVWKFLQQANVSVRAAVGRGLRFEGGIFTSPIGCEGFAVHDQWNWSRSNLFFGLPFYHTGVRISYPLTDRWTVSLAGYNGWNSVVDNNVEKSVAVAIDYVVADRVTFHALYFGGVERNVGAPERLNGNLPWRSSFDTYVAVHPTSWLSLIAHGNVGLEPNAFGLSWWATGALYARVRPVRWMYIAARGDFFYEGVPGGTIGTAVASSIFWPSAWVASPTLTVDIRPHDNVSVRLEYRHDHAAGPTYFRGTVASAPMTMAFVPNAASQDTLTLGMTAWF